MVRSAVPRDPGRREELPAGTGPLKQSTEVDLDKVAAIATSVGDLPAGAPVAGRDAYLVMALWLLCEVEGGTARLEDITFEPDHYLVGCGKATWDLPASKTDVRAL